MTTKTVELSLGPVMAMAEPPKYQTGWYRDPVTGQQYYYDALKNQWYVYAAGYLYALGYMEPAPKKVTVAPGDKLQVILSFKYTGPAITGILTRYCVGVFGAFGFNERLSGTPTFNVPANLSATPVKVTNSYTFTIPTNVDTDWDDIYVKIWGGTPDIGGTEQSPARIFGYENALTVVGAVINITEFKIDDFKKV